MRSSSTAHPLAKTTVRRQRWQPGFLGQLVEAIDSKMNAVARGETQVPGTTETARQALQHEIAATARAIASGGKVVDSGDKWQREFVSAVTTARARDALVHEIHAVGGATQFAASVMHAWDKQATKQTEKPRR